MNGRRPEPKLNPAGDELGRLIVADQLLAKSDTAALVLRFGIRYSSTVECRIDVLLRSSHVEAGSDLTRMITGADSDLRLGFSIPGQEPVLAIPVASCFDRDPAFHITAAGGGSHHYNLQHEVFVPETARDLVISTVWAERGIEESHYVVSLGSSVSGSELEIW